MKRTCIALALIACQDQKPCVHHTAKATPPLFQQLENMYERSVFPVIVSEPNGTVKRGTGFLVAPYLLVTTLHLWDDPALWQNATASIRLNKLLIPAIPRFRDSNNDIAILTVPVEGSMFTVRTAVSSDELGYMLGFLPYESGGLKQSFNCMRVQLVDSDLYESPDGHNVLRLTALGVFVEGMSGSPLVASDGNVIGMLTGQRNDAPHVGAFIDARYIAEDLQTYQTITK